MSLIQSISQRPAGRSESFQNQHDRRSVVSLSLDSVRGHWVTTWSKKWSKCGHSTGTHHNGYQSSPNYFRNWTVTIKNWFEVVTGRDHWSKSGQFKKLIRDPPIWVSNVSKFLDELIGQHKNIIKGGYRSWPLVKMWSIFEKIENTNLWVSNYSKLFHQFNSHFSWCCRFQFKVFGQ